MGPPLTRAVRERSSPRLPTVQSGAIRPFWDGQFTASHIERAEGGTHRLGAKCIDRTGATQREGYAPECVEGRRSRKFVSSILHRSLLRAARRPSERLRSRSPGGGVLADHYEIDP